MFRLPQLPPEAKQLPTVGQCHGMPCFRFKEFTRVSLIGSGGYGKIYCGRYNKKEVVVKILADAEQSDVLKEAKFLHRLNHINVVDFVAICPLKKQ